MAGVVAVRGCVRTTVGQAELLVAERFKQFAGLVDNCEFGTGQKEVTPTDLQGFWDMIYFQVHNRFNVTVKHLVTRFTRYVCVSTEMIVRSETNVRLMLLIHINSS